MEVLQYHFTGWPDHGAPDAGCEYPALDFILKSAAANQDGSITIVFLFEYLRHEVNMNITSFTLKRE